jgi:hypothetical protein
MKIPVIINNRNLLTYPKKMVEDIENFSDLLEIIIVDNGSTYEPLIEWYKTNPCEIIYSENLGHLAPWILDVPRKRKYDYYVVTDPDLDLSNTPKNCLNFILEKLQKYNNFNKIGLSLCNWKVSKDSPYHEFLINWATKNWNKEYIKDELLISQEVDTTFAMYNVNRHYRGLSCATNYPYSAKHIPWEFTIDIISDLKNKNYEYYYYLCNSSNSSSYKNFINFKN